MIHHLLEALDTARLPYAAFFQMIGLNAEIPHVRSNNRFDPQWARATSLDPA
jgi:hypothetical protein